MQGLMQHWSLTVDRILDHAARWHGAREIVTRSIERVIVMSDGDTVPATKIAQLMAYEPLLAASPAAWGGFDESTAAGLCYTSGTTGNPRSAQKSSCPAAA